MAVYVTGDIHGNPVRLSKDNFYEQKDFSNNEEAEQKLKEMNTYNGITE